MMEGGGVPRPRSRPTSRPRSGPKILSTLNLSKLFRLGSEASKLFEEMDKNGDGEIDVEELRRIMGHEHSATFMEFVDGTHVGEKDGVIDQKEWLHYFEYIMRHEGYEEANRSLTWVRGWVERRKLASRRKIEAAALIQRRFRGFRLRADRARWNKVLKERKRVAKMQVDLEYTMRVLKDTKRVLAAERFRIGRLSVQLESRQRTIQERDDDIARLRQRLEELAERLRMSRVEADMRNVDAHDRMTRFKSTLSDLRSQHKNCLDRERTLREAQVSYAIDVLRRFRRENIVLRTGNQIETERAAQKIERDDQKIAASLFRAIAMDDGRTIEYLRGQLCPSRLLQLRNKGGESAMEFAKRRRRFDALQVLRRLSEEERDVIVDAVDRQKKDEALAAKRREEQQEEDRRSTALIEAIHDVEIADGATCSDQIVSCECEAGEETVSSTKQKLIDAKRIADNFRRSQLARQSLRRRLHRIRDAIETFSSFATARLDGISRRIHYSERTLGSIVISVPSRREMSSIDQPNPGLRRDSTRDQSAHDHDTDVPPTIESFSHETTVKDNKPILNTMDTKASEQEEKIKEEEEEKPDISDSTSGTTVMTTTTTTTTTTRRKGKTMDAAFMALRLHRSLQITRMRQARAERNKRRTDAALHCEIRRLSELLRRRDEELRIVTYAMENLWRERNASTKTRKRAVRMREHLSRLDSTLQEDFSNLVRLLQRYGPTRRLWDALCEDDRRSIDNNGSLRPGKAFETLLQSEASRIQRWWRRLMTGSSP